LRTVNWPVACLSGLIGFVEAWAGITRFFLFCVPVLAFLPSIAAESSAEEIRLPLNLNEDRTIANTNSVEAVGSEVLSPALLSAIASAHSIPLTVVKGIEITRSPDNADVLVRSGEAVGDFGVIVKDLRWYIHGRAEGHSVAFMFGCLTNRAWRLTNPEGDMKELANRDAKLPTALLRKWESGGYTNRAGTPAEINHGKSYADGRFRDYTNTVYRSKDEVVSWTNYILIDGELAWIYQVRHPSLGSEIENYNWADAKEFDPRFRDKILRAEKEARAELERRGQASPRQWRVDRLKKEMLKAQGIDWRSPADLNPGPHRE